VPMQNFDAGSISLDDNIQPVRMVSNSSIVWLHRQNTM